MVDLGPVTCQGYWPDEGTPCLRPLNPDGTCPKAWSDSHGYRTLADELLDPRWDWCNIQTMADPGPRWIKGACKHLDPEPVMVTDLVTGEQIVVARLCTDCDTQLDTDWTDVPQAKVHHPALGPQHQEPNGFERWVYGTSPAHSGPIPEGYRVNPSSKDPYADLIFVGGGVVNRHPRPSWLARAGGAVLRGTAWYWERYMELWESMKRGVDFFWDTLPFMWPVYVIMIDWAWKAVHG